MCDGDRSPERSSSGITADEQAILDAVSTTGFTPGLSPEALAAWLATQGRESEPDRSGLLQPVGSTALQGSFED